MSSPLLPRRRTTAAALLAATLTAAAVPGALAGGGGEGEAGVPARALAADTVTQVAVAPAPSAQPAAPAAEARPAPATTASSIPAAPAPAPVAGGTAPARGDGLTGPAEAVLDGAPAPEVEPVRVVAQTVDAGGRPDWRVFEAATREEALAAVEAARAVPDVERVTLDQTAHALTVPPRYDDPGRPRQWALDTLKAESAAAVSAGTGVLVAVLDTGVRGDHEDFAAGSVLPGRSYVADGYGSTGDVDPQGHGTHVAGIIAAARNNARGVAGLSGATILPLRVLGANGSGSSTGIATAIRDAADQGAKVISMSLGGSGSYDPYVAAVDYARKKGAVVIAAAGNARQSGDPVNYPGATPGVLTVAASTPSDVTATFSSTGSHVEVTAPGQWILGLGHKTPTSYVEMSGTSMATPYVSGAAAMLVGAKSGLTPADVESALTGTARDIEQGGRDNLSGFGVIDPLAALQEVSSGTPAPEPAPAPAPAPQPAPAPNAPPTATADAATTVVGTATTVDVRANDSDPDGDVLTVTGVTRPSRGLAALSGGTVRYTPPSRWTGTDSFSYTISDGRGGTATARVTVTVSRKPNQAPIAVADRVTMPQRVSARIAVLSNDRDPERDRLAVVSVGAASHGTTAVVPGGVRYTPASTFSGTDSFTYVVSDGRGGTATGTVTVTVRPVNALPSAVADTATTTRATPVRVPVLTNDKDPDGDTLGVVAVSSARGGRVSVADGAVVFTPNSSFTGRTSFRYRVSDGRGGVSTGRVTITVTAGSAPTGGERA